jgi:hypothetical protein
MLPFGVTIPATVPQGSEIPEGLMNNPVFYFAIVVKILLIIAWALYRM